MTILRDKTAWTLIAAAALVIAASLLRPTGPQEGIYHEEQFRLKITSGDDYDIVIAGDSHIENGVSPAAMSGILPGQRIFNFSFAGVAFTPDYLEAVRARLDPKSRRPAIVIGLTPMSLSTFSAEDNRFIHLSRNPPGGPGWLGEMRSRLAFIFRPIRELNIEHQLGGEPRGYRWIFHPDGWVATSRFPEDDKEYLEHLHRRLTQETIDPAIFENLLAGTKRWSDEGIAVFGFRPPVSNRVSAMEDSLSIFPELEAARRFEDAGGYWLTFDASRYHYVDGSHMRYDAAIEFSRDLAKAVAQILTAREEGLLKTSP
jgi:hypothetical protein